VGPTTVGEPHSQSAWNTQAVGWLGSKSSKYGVAAASSTSKVRVFTSRLPAAVDSSACTSTVTMPRLATVGVPVSSPVTGSMESQVWLPFPPTMDQSYTPVPPLAST